MRLCHALTHHSATLLSPSATRPAWSISRRLWPAFGVELISTGGTRKALADAGLKVLDISEVTGFPEMLDGRVKTLHPRVHGGILSIRDNPQHQATIKEHKIEPIDLVVCNLYPFEATLAKPRQHARGDRREHRHRRPVDGAVGGQELSRRRHRHRSVAVRRDRPGVEAAKRRLVLATRERLAGAAFAPHRRL